MAIHRLLVKDGQLYFPVSSKFWEPDAIGQPSLLVRMYDSGDADTIPWPFPEDRQAEMARRLARALYDERETNDEWGFGDTVELPDGQAFDFDNLVE